MAGTSTVDRDADLNSFHRNGESDVEILSNPSQSSIEVLDYNQSSRKHSEERRVSQLPSLDTILYDPEEASRLYAMAAAASTADVERINATTQNHQPPPSEMDKKIILNQINLTESSSSGSVTDSICTAYEQNSKTSNTNSMETSTTSKPTPPISPEKTLTPPPKTDSSVISSMLGGLFQSTNLLMSRSQRSDAAAAKLPPCEEYKYSYSQFDQVDHRIKLFLYESIFEDFNEHFKWLVRGKIVLENGQQNGGPKIIDGICVMSTTRFYVLQKTAAER